MSKPEFERVAVNNIEATAATQVRIRIDKGMVDQYTEDFENGAAFPPLTCFREENSERIILADGFHRLRAAINAGREEIGCNIFVGGMREALMEALGSNAEHGFRRTKADKRHAVQMALKDPEISQLQQQEIAEVCRVHRNTVRKIQNEMLAEDSSNGDAHNVHDKEPEDPKPDDFRDDGKEPTQMDIDYEEVSRALNLIKGIPYDGDTAVGKLAFTPDDIADLEYVSTWCANAVLTYRTMDEEEEGGDG